MSFTLVFRWTRETGSHTDVLCDIEHVRLRHNQFNYRRTQKSRGGNPQNKNNINTVKLICSATIHQNVKHVQFVGEMIIEGLNEFIKESCLSCLLLI